MKTYNFKIQEYDYDCPDKYKGEYYDFRNGITCINPTVDLECYLNYIELLNLKKDKWVSSGYLDLGLMPVAMAPSFMQGIITETMLEIMKLHKIPCHSMPPVSLLLSKCRVSGSDIWVKKSDVAKVTGIPEDKLTLEKFIHWCIGKK